MMATEPGLVTVHVEHDLLGRPNYSIEFPPGPFLLMRSPWSYEGPLVRAGVLVVRGHTVTLAGRKFLAVDDDNPCQAPALICYPICDPWSYIRLAAYHTRRYFRPLTRWVAFQFYFAGWIKQGECFSLRHLFRRLLDQTISGPAPSAPRPAQTIAAVTPTIRAGMLTVAQVRAVETALDAVYPSPAFSESPPNDAPIPGADDGRVEPDRPYGVEDEARWAEYNRKFNAMLLGR